MRRENIKTWSEPQTRMKASPKLIAEKYFPGCPFHTLVGEESTFEKSPIAGALVAENLARPRRLHLYRRQHMSYIRTAKKCRHVCCRSIMGVQEQEEELLNEGADAVIEKPMEADRNSKPYLI